MKLLGSLKLLMDRKEWQLKDIPDRLVLEHHQQFHKENEESYQKWKKEKGVDGVSSRFRWAMEGKGLPYPEELIQAKLQCPMKLVNKKQESLVDKGYLEYGVNINGAWLTDKGKEYLEQLQKENKEKE